jgi:hypothetical protein
VAEFIVSGWCCLAHLPGCPKGIGVPCVVRDGVMLCEACDQRTNPPGAAGVCPVAGSP